MPDVLAQVQEWAQRVRRDRDCAAARLAGLSVAITAYLLFAAGDASIELHAALAGGGGCA